MDVVKWLDLVRCVEAGGGDVDLVGPVLVGESERGAAVTAETPASLVAGTVIGEAAVERYLTRTEGRPGDDGCTDRLLAHAAMTM